MIVFLAFAQGRNRIGNEDFMELIVEICQLKIKEATDSRKIVLDDEKQSQYHNHCGRKKLCATVHHSSFSDKVHVRVVTEVSKCQIARRPLSYDHLVQREEQSRTLDADWREVSSLDVKTTL